MGINRQKYSLIAFLEVHNVLSKRDIGSLDAVADTPFSEL
jgi:hypothetical protein